MNNLIGSKNSRSTRYFEIVVLLILLAGITMRLFHYLYNRSLWLDELYLCSSLVHMSYQDLATQALDYGQKAPIGFLFLVKFPITIFGNQEMVLRIIPFIAGILSLLLFLPVCRYFLKPIGVVVALSIFAFAPALIYHSVEIKQYSTECLATIIAFCLYINFVSKVDWASRITWGILGGLLVWFSFSVIFILAGIAIGSCINYSLKKEWKLLWPSIVPYTVWLLSFILNYILFTHKHAESQWVVYFFKTYDNFMPFPPHSLQELKWFPRNLVDLFDYPLGLVWNLKAITINVFTRILAVPIFPILLLIAGFYSLYKNSLKIFFVFIIPILLTLIASGLELYPLIERFWLFIAPILILIIAMGFEVVQNKLKSRMSINIIALLIICGPFVQSVYAVVYPDTFYKHKKSYEQEGFTYINNHFKNGDAVYNYWNNAPGYQVYKQINNYKFKAIQGLDYRKKSKDLEEYNKNLHKDFKQFTGYKRVWLMLNHRFLTDIGDLADDPKWYYKNQSAPVDNLLREFNKLGKPLKKYVYSDVTIYIFELRHPVDNTIH